MRIPYVSRAVVLCSFAVIAGGAAYAQDDAAGALSRAIRESTTAPASKNLPPMRIQAGAAIGSTGTSLETSETIFTIMAGLNACGYDAGLASAPPARLRVREQMTQAIESSPEAASAHDKLCAFVRAHDLGDPVKTLSQYVSLGLVLKPGPELETAADLKQLPPDATQVANILPLLRAFSAAVHLHAIWLIERPAYDAAIAPLREPLTKMLLTESVYLRLNETGNDARRFIVLAEPLIAPGIVSARVYGLDYLMVLAPPSSPENTHFLDDVRHFYLQFAVDPVLFGYPRAMERLEPVLAAVREAPIDQIYRDDIATLVSECLIRAIEAHTMDTGIVIPRLRAGERLQTEGAHLYDERIQQDAAVRTAAVERDVQQGFVLTRYFYNQFAQYEKVSDTTFRNALGEMVYGMDPDLERKRASKVVFVDSRPEATGRRQNGGPALGARSAGLTPEGGGGAAEDHVSEAEQALGDGKLDAAVSAAQTALDRHEGDAGRATYVLAQAHAMHGEMQDAQTGFSTALTLTKDPHTLAWSHIYLGRIADLMHDREKALTEYKAALNVKSGLPDADAAAHRGLEQAFAPPAGAHSASPPTASGATDSQ